ncbi:MAG: hypothetical protein AB7F51_02825 [Pseudorhodoplanes sp.]
MDDSLYNNLPEDPEEAFLVLEEHFRIKCDRRISNAGEQTRHDVIYVDYIAEVLGAITALGLETEFKSRVPPIEEVDYNTYLNFNKDVKNYCTILKIKNARRTQGFSVQFDEAARLKIHHHIAQLREFFGKLELKENKRDALLIRLDELANEVNLSRTRFDRFAALGIEAAGVAGEIVEKSKMLEILDAIGRVFWGAQKDKPKQLPAPTEPKKIEPPKPKPRPKQSRDMDDEIPF